MNAIRRVFRAAALVSAALALALAQAQPSVPKLLGDLLKLKTAKEEADRQRKAEQARQAAASAPAATQPNIFEEGARRGAEAQAQAVLCGDRGCRKTSSDPTLDLPVVEEHVRLVSTRCVKSGERAMTSGYVRYVDLAEVLRRFPQAVVLSAEEIDASRGSHRGEKDEDWGAIRSAGSHVMKTRKTKGVDNGAWVLDASPRSAAEVVPAMFAYVVDLARVPDELRSMPVTTAESYLERVHRARRDQVERQACSAPAGVATAALPPAPRATPVWLDASGAPDDRPIEAKATAPAWKRVLSAGVHSISRDTGELSLLPSPSNGLNPTYYGGGGTTRAVVDASGTLVLRGAANALGGIVMTASEAKLTPLVRTRLSVESQPVLHPKLNVVYVITGDYGRPGHHGISAYRFDAGTGALTPVEGSTAPLGVLDAGVLPGFDIGIAPDGSAAYLYDGRQKLHAFRIDTGTGALAPVAGSPFATMPTAGALDVLAVHPTGRFLWLASHEGGHQGFAVQPGTGVLMPMPASTSAGATGCSSKQKLVFDPSGRFGYSTSRSTTVLVCGFSVDPASGALAALPGSPWTSRRILSATLGPYVSPNGRFLYVENYDDTNPIHKHYEIVGLAIDPATGALRPMGTSRQAGSTFAAPGGPAPCGLYRNRLAFDPTGEYAYGPEWSYQANPRTGMLTGLPRDSRDRRNCFVAL